MDIQNFDKVNRVTAKDAETLPVNPWQLPTIDKSGHFIPAQPRDTGKKPMQANTSQQDHVSEEQVHAAARQEGLKAGRDEGLKAGREEGLAAGKEEGLKLGRQQAEKDCREELSSKLGQLNKLMTSLAHSLNQEDYKLEKAILNLVTGIARAVVRRELSMDSGHIMKIIKEVMSAMPPSRDNIKIYLNPRDKNLVDTAISQGGENWRAVADEDISEGGCRIESEQSVADFTAEFRFESAVDHVLNNPTSIPAQGDDDFEEAQEPVVRSAVEEGGEPEPDLESEVQSLETLQAGLETSKPDNSTSAPN